MWETLWHIWCAAGRVQTVWTVLLVSLYCKTFCLAVPGETTLAKLRLTSWWIGCPGEESQSLETNIHQNSNQVMNRSYSSAGRDWIRGSIDSRFPTFINICHPLVQQSTSKKPRHLPTRRNLQKCLSAKPALTEEHLKSAARGTHWVGAKRLRFGEKWKGKGGCPCSAWDCRLVGISSPRAGWAL